MHSWGQSQLGVISAGRLHRLCWQRCLVLSFFLSFNTSFSHTSRHLILTKHRQSDRYLNHYSRTNNNGVGSHDGVTRVKRSFSLKCYNSSILYRMTIEAHACASAGDTLPMLWVKCHIHKLDPFYKTY